MPDVVSKSPHEVRGSIKHWPGRHVRLASCNSKPKACFCVGGGGHQKILVNLFWQASYSGFTFVRCNYVIPIESCMKSILDKDDFSI